MNQNITWKNYHTSESRSLCIKTLLNSIGHTSLFIVKKFNFQKFIMFYIQNKILQNAVNLASNKNSCKISDRVFFILHHYRWFISQQSSAIQSAAIMISEYTYDKTLAIQKWKIPIDQPGNYFLNWIQTMKEFCKRFGSLKWKVHASK